MWKLKPDSFFDSVKDITVDYIKKLGKRGVILDIDDTLSGHNNEVFDEDVRAWLSSLQEAGIRVCLLSNNSKERAQKAAMSLGLSAIGRARKPLKRGFYDAALRMGLPLEDVCVIGDQIFTDILGGNRLNLYTILVEPMTMRATPLSRLKRFLERPVMKSIRRKKER